jgi:MFS family permease
MPIRFFPKKLQAIFTRPALVTIFLLANALVWYSYAIDIVNQSITGLDLGFTSNVLLWGIHFSSLIVSALIGVFLTKRLGGRLRFLTLWLTLGVVASLMPIVVNTGEVWGAVSLSLIFGASFGFGMPNCMGYFNSQVPVENRGKIGGVIILFTGVGTIALALIPIGTTIMQTVILTSWRALGLVALPLATKTVKIEEDRKNPAYRSILKQKSFLLYFVPWIMFSLLNYLTSSVQQNVLHDQSMIADLQLLGNIFLGAFALLGGVFMDKVGRKRLAIIGFVMLGLSYSFLGFFRDPSIWYLHTVMNGTSWGILYVLFVMTVWGELSHDAPTDKYYALGVSPFFISKMLQLTINSQIVASIDVTTIFSFTAFFLFLAVLPLIYAPETLPEKTMKDRELKNYIEKAQKEAAKALNEEDDGKQCEKEDEEDSVEFKVNPEDDEKAQELAEKYY